MEEWKEIVETSNYDVSNLGNIRNRNTGRVLKGRLSKSGYLQVSLTLILTGRQKNQYIHRLVAQYWVLNNENKKEVNHKDGNKLNNRCDNLEWVTSSENQLHRQHILGKQQTSQRRIGRYNKEGQLLEEYDSILSAVKQFSQSRSNIDAVLQGRQKTAYGFVWKYLN